jgi:hypothetical protein
MEFSLQLPHLDPGLRQPQLRSNHQLLQAPPSQLLQAPRPQLLQALLHQLLPPPQVQHPRQRAQEPPVPGQQSPLEQLAQQKACGIASEAHPSSNAQVELGRSSNSSLQAPLAQPVNQQTSTSLLAQTRSGQSASQANIFAATSNSPPKQRAWSLADQHNHSLIELGFTLDGVWK